MNKLIIGIGILILALLWSNAIITKSISLDNKTYYYLGDDAMISMRYAKNLSEGNGLVWNSGERVEGYTNFLWTMYMSGIHFLVDQSKTSLLIIITNMILCITGLYVTAKLLWTFTEKFWITLLVMPLYIVNVDIFYWGLAGFECILEMVLFTYSLYRLRIKDYSINTFLIIGLIAIVRADGLILSGLLWLYAIIDGKEKKKILIYSLISSVFFIGHLIFRLWYYGDILPNTFYLKVTNFDNRIQHGISYSFDFFLTYSPLFILIFLSLKKKFDLAFYLIPSYFLYIIFIGGDAFDYNRFFIPIIPFLIIYACYRMSLLPYYGCLLIVFIGYKTLIPEYSYIITPTIHDSGNLVIGKMLDRDISKDAIVADFWAGTTMYFCNRKGVDLLGKCDKYIARLNANKGVKPGHNKYDFNYSIGKLKPDYIIANYKLPINPNWINGMCSGDYSFSGQLYLDENLRNNYVPLNINIWRTVYKKCN